MKYLKEFTDYSTRIKDWADSENHPNSNLDDSLGHNEFQTAFNWIEQFGGRELLSSKYIKNGESLLKALENNEITIEEIDEVTKGDHGQVGDISFSETYIASHIVIPHIEDYKMKSKSNKYNI